MEYFAGLDVSMAETHACVVTREALKSLATHKTDRNDAEGIRTGCP
jgi:hypothetical protein